MKATAVPKGGSLRSARSFGDLPFIVARVFCDIMTDTAFGIPLCCLWQSLGLVRIGLITKALSHFAIVDDGFASSRRLVDLTTGCAWQRLVCRGCSTLFARAHL